MMSFRLFSPSYISPFFFADIVFPLLSDFLIDLLPSINLCLSSYKQSYHLLYLSSLPLSSYMQSYHPLYLSSLPLSSYKQ